MKKYLFAAAAAFLVALPLSASVRPENGKFALKGEWIYFFPSLEDTYFVIQGTGGSPIGEKTDNRFNYTSGYRVEGIYSFCNCLNDLRLRWTHLLRKTHSKSEAGTSLFATEAPPFRSDIAAGYIGVAGSEIRMEYYAAEAMLGQLIYDCSPFTLEAQVGIHYGHVKFDEELAYISTAPVADLVIFSDTFNGVGPELAFDADYALYSGGCCCPGTLYLTSTLRGALLVSKSKAKFTSYIGPETALVQVYDVQDNRVWRVVPWLDMKVGLSYASSCFECFTVSVEAGYEVGSYLKAVSKERFTDNLSAGYSFNQFQDFTYHGPYVAAEVIF